MRWERFFSDLEAQFEAERDAELRDEAAERSRAEQARVWLSERLRARVGGDVQVVLTGGSRVRGRCTDAAVEWMLLEDASGTLLVPLAAVAVVEGAAHGAATEAGAALRRLGLASVLRGAARRRATIQAVTTGGDVHGTVDRVGADFFDVAVHPADEPRRVGAVRQVSSVPFGQLLLVRFRDAGW
ncbi:hypothetical protein [Thalassiella azotivora]